MYCLFGEKWSSSDESINAKAGKVTVKKGTKKGVYKMTVAVNAKGDKNFNQAKKNVAVTIKVAK